jgi:protein tyrosine phosphatase (PTP) superfamily phosphohydrolase (DUF442 family)
MLVRLAASFLVLLAAPGCGVLQVVDRSHDGEPILIRSPQPDSDDLRSLHERFGVKTVVNLRGESPGESWFEEERRGVEAIGARWVHLRTSGKREPGPELVQSFLELVEDERNWPIVIHCQGGVHRTGLLAALYRIQYQGWSPKQAIREMEDCYFDWTVNDREALKRWLRGYQRDPGRQVVRGPLRSLPSAVAAAAPSPAAAKPE